MTELGGPLDMASTPDVERFMTRRPKLWLVVASLFTLVNLAGAPFAALSGEPLHAAIHVALTLVGAYFVARLAPRARRQHLLGTQPAEERLDRLQHSLDAIAIEVERVGEAQRFLTKLGAERARASPAEPSSDES
jgi:hypothetical protein